ncbi:hypothetical protein [Aequorivita capsosiphonis]|uniref:hypothetical protein n=1 Tax=Aequorivita capsosiphonis TaxID=487317 RepID=UPI0012FC04BA|nr:hypothetical protein [Aequorivita capsosiphonis]
MKIRWIKKRNFKKDDKRRINENILDSNPVVFYEGEFDEMIRELNKQAESRKRNSR